MRNSNHKVALTHENDSKYIQTYPVYLCRSTNTESASLPILKMSEVSMSKYSSNMHAEALVRE